MIRAGEKMPKHTMPWIYRTRTSITKSSLSRNLDHLEGPRSEEFGGSLQSSLLLRLSRSISMLLTKRSTQEALSAKKAPCQTLANERVNGRGELLNKPRYLTITVALPPLLLRTVMLCGLTGQVNSARNLPPPWFESVPISWPLEVTNA